MAGKRGRTNKLPTFIFHLSVYLDFINDIGPCGEVAKLQIWLHVGAVRLKILRTTDGTGHGRLGTGDWALWQPFKVEQLEQIPLEILSFDSLSMMMMIAHAHSNNNFKNIVK